MKETTTIREKIVEIQQGMFNFALQLTSDYESANDLIQETTLKVLTNEEKYSAGTNFKAWVFTIMKNIFINEYRHNVRRGEVIDQSEDYMMTCQESTLQSPEGSYTMKEISKAIDKISDDFRIPFTMFLQGYKYSEIAKKLNITEGTIKSRVFYTRKRLQEELKDLKG